MKRIYLVFLLFLFSCKQQGPVQSDFGNGQPLDLNPLGHVEEGIESPAIGTQRFIQLEETPLSHIEGITKIIYRNDKFYVLDRFINKSIYIFSDHGKFIKKISSLGLGFGKYLELNDFDVDNTGSVYIWDNYGSRGGKFVVFKENGTVNEIKTRLHLFEFKLKGENDIVISRSYSNGVVKSVFGTYNLIDGNLTNFIPNRGVFDNLNLLNYSYNDLYSSGNSLLFHKRFSNSIYQFDSNGLKERFSLKTDQLPPQSFIQAVVDNETFKKDTSYIKAITEIYENSQFTIMKLIGKPVTSHLLVAKKDSKQLFFSRYPGNYLGDSKIYGVCNDQFITLLDVADRVKSPFFVKELANLKLDNDQQKLILASAAAKNPVIELFKFTL